MNQLDPSSLIAARDAMQARFARRIVMRLNDEAAQVGGDVAERLRFARESALARARLARSPAQVGVTSAGAAMLGGGWWVKLASVLPLLALVCGLVLIQRLQATAQISVAAEVDAALLADDLPPTAYRDAGFVEFLKTPPHE
ncbi:MAG: DUF3619 family protein [Caldimonas sp.]